VLGYDLADSNVQLQLFVESIEVAEQVYKRPKREQQSLDGAKQNSIKAEELEVSAQLKNEILATAYYNRTMT
jgi:hypothetical protein